MANVLNRTTKQYLKSVNTIDYLSDDWLVNPYLSSVEGLEKKYWNITGNIVVPMNQAERDAVDNSLIDEYRQTKYNEIDAKTEELIYQGFNFDGKLFSLSSNAQFNWVKMASALASGTLTEAKFPYTVSTRNNGSYALAWADLSAFLGAATLGVESNLATGRALKNLVENAQTVPEILAVEDNR